MINLLLSSGRDIQWGTLAVAVGIMAASALLLGVCIMLISKLCAVEEDPRIKEVEGCLAGANCGACGYAGCSGYAKALVEGTAKMDACGQTDSEKKNRICEILGIESDANSEPTVAVVACSGGVSCKDRFEYVGEGSCLSQNALKGGRKACLAGCLGGGDCKKACPYRAIDVTNDLASVNPDLCKSCGLCIATCPKKLISRVPVSAKVYVACSSSCKGKEVMGACQVGCIACGKCQRSCPNGAITMQNNLPVIDYSKCTSCGKCAEGCPRKCIKTR